MKNSLRSICLHDGYPVIVKDESFSMSGTHKDRRSEAIIAQCQKEGRDRVSIITAGNGGYSLALASKGRIKVNAIVDSSIPPHRFALLRETGANVIPFNLQHPLSSEDIERLTGGKDFTNSMEHAYKPIVDEILQGGVKPDAIVVPVGSGELFLGIHTRVKELHLQTDVIGVGVESPTSKADKLYASWTPNRKTIREVTMGKNTLFFLSDQEVQYEIDHAPCGLHAEPSALVVFAAVRQLRERYKTMVAVNTGKGKFVQEALWAA